MCWVVALIVVGAIHCVVGKKTLCDFLFRKASFVAVRVPSVFVDCVACDPPLCLLVFHTHTHSVIYFFQTLFNPAEQIVSIILLY